MCARETRAVSNDDGAMRADGIAYSLNVTLRYLVSWRSVDDIPSRQVPECLQRVPAQHCCWLLPAHRNSADWRSRPSPRGVATGPPTSLCNKSRHCDFRLPKDKGGAFLTYTSIPAVAPLPAATVAGTPHRERPSTQPVQSEHFNCSVTDVCPSCGKRSTGQVPFAGLQGVCQGLL